MISLLSGTKIVLRFWPLRPLEAAEALKIVSFSNKASLNKWVVTLYVDFPYINSYSQFYFPKRGLSTLYSVNWFPKWLCPRGLPPTLKMSMQNYGEICPAEATFIFSWMDLKLDCIYLGPKISSLVFCGTLLLSGFD